jgi:hypothetical protein
MATAEEPAPAVGSYTIAKSARSRWWEVRDGAGELVCLAVYRRGASEVVRRLSQPEAKA